METITFYSYKGGSGRSSTALNTLPYLVDVLEANKKSPILLLDMDLDSAGMTYLLGLDKHFQNDTYDIKSFLRAEENWSENPASSLDEHTFYKKFVPVGEKLGVENEAVVFLGVDDGKSIDNGEMTGDKEVVFTKLDHFCRKNNISAVVIDSSAGDQYSALLSIQASSVVINCLRATTQFRIGTFNYLYRLKTKNIDKKIILLPTVVPIQDRVIDGIQQRQDAVRDILEKIKALGLDNIKTDFISIDKLGINEVERFKWREGVLYDIGRKQSLTDDEKEATERYSRLAHTIVAGDHE